MPRIWANVKTRAAARATAILALSAVFLVLVYAVESGATLPLDRAVLMALRKPGDLAAPIGPTWLLAVMRGATTLGSTRVTLGLMAIGALAAYRSRLSTAAMFLLFAIGGGSVVVNLIKLAVARIRPDVVPHLTSEVTYSFPSSHAAVSVLTYGALATVAAHLVPSVGPVVKAAAVAIVLVISSSRLYLGVHYPSDVLAGWVCGAAWLLVCRVCVSRGVALRPPSLH